MNEPKTGVEKKSPPVPVRRQGIPLIDRDQQQTMDDNQSEIETGDLELQRRPRDAERMILDSQPGDRERE